MTWIEKVKANRDVLFDLIATYHPAYGPVDCKYEITAKSAETVSRQLREGIREHVHCPLAMFEKALEENDSVVINSLLNETWIGIPESRGLIVELGEKFTLLCDLCADYNWSNNDET